MYGSDEEDSLLRGFGGCLIDLMGYNSEEVLEVGSWELGGM
jgi:hypothetical protein